MQHLRHVNVYILSLSPHRLIHFGLVFIASNRREQERQVLYPYAANPNPFFCFLLQQPNAKSNISANCLFCQLCYAWWSTFCLKIHIQRPPHALYAMLVSWKMLRIQCEATKYVPRIYRFSLLHFIRFFLFNFRLNVMEPIIMVAKLSHHGFIAFFFTSPIVCSLPELEMLHCVRRYVICRKAPADIISC